MRGITKLVNAVIYITGGTFGILCAYYLRQDAATITVELLLTVSAIYALCIMLVAIGVGELFR